MDGVSSHNKFLTTTEEERKKTLHVEKCPLYTFQAFTFLLPRDSKSVKIQIF